MTTKALISRVIPWCPGWERSSGKKNLLKLAEQGLDELFDFDHDCMIFRGTDNQGFPPYLTTVSETYDYSLTAANLSCDAITRDIGGTAYTLIARKVNRVLVDVTTFTSTYARTYMGRPYYTTLNPYTTQSIRLLLAEETVSSQPAYENTPATIKFQQDPGSYSDKFFVEFFIGPPRLLSESIQMPIPTTFERAIEDYIIGSVQEREHGSPSEMFAKFENYWKPKFQNYMASGISMEDKNTPIRLC